MDLRQFELELRTRGGEADVWLVYAEESRESIVGGAPALKLQRSFWTRGEAYAFAHAAHEARRWRHYHVFRVSVDVDWLPSGDPRAAQYETTFGRARKLIHMDVLATEIMGVLESAP